MDPAYLATLGTKALVEMLIALLKRGQTQDALDVAEELGRRELLEEAQRTKVTLWRRVFGK